MPPEVVSYDLQFAKAAYELAESWHTADVMGIGRANPRNASPAQLSGWSSEQVRLCTFTPEFLTHVMPNMSCISFPGQIPSLDAFNNDIGLKDT